VRSNYLFGAVIAVALAFPAQAQLLNHKDLSLATALAIATTAGETCKAQGNRVTVAVIGRTGEIIVQLRGDDASPHTIENSFRKAYTAHLSRRLGRVRPAAKGKRTRFCAVAQQYQRNARRAADQGR
jgi:uncharacterized protein GlcG (DUF336 family)